MNQSFKKVNKMIYNYRGFWHPEVAFNTQIGDVYSYKSKSISNAMIEQFVCVEAPEKGETGHVTLYQTTKRAKYCDPIQITYEIGKDNARRDGTVENITFRVSAGSMYKVPQLKKDRIVFLDVDGPIIPDKCYIWDRMSSYEYNFDESAMSLVENIIVLSGAKLVMNTTHNTQFDVLKAAMIKSGHFVDSDFHESPNTSFPLNKCRTSAVKQWIRDNYDTHYDLTDMDNVFAYPVDWVAFDDVKIEDERAYLIDQCEGVSIGAYNHAAEYFNFRPVYVM